MPHGVDLVGCAELPAQYIAVGNAHDKRIITRHQPLTDGWRKAHREVRRLAHRDVFEIPDRSLVEYLLRARPDMQLASFFGRKKAHAAREKPARRHLLNLIEPKTNFLIAQANNLRGRRANKISSPFCEIETTGALPSTPG